MLSKNFSAPIFPVSTKNIKKASIQLNPSNFQNNLALIARSTSHKGKQLDFLQVTFIQELIIEIKN